MSVNETDPPVSDQPFPTAEVEVAPEPGSDSEVRPRPTRGALNRAVRESQLEVNAGIHRLLGMLVLLGTLYTCYFASELILPILLAAFFALLLSPVMKRLTSGWLPRWIAAFLLIAVSMATLVGIGNALYAPASEWASRAPRVIHNVTPKIKSLMRPLTEANKMGDSLNEMTGEKKSPQRVVVQAPDRPSLLSTTPRVLASVLAVVLLTYFFLLYGETLMRRTLMMRSTWQQKRVTVDIIRSIQSDISRYFLTVCSTSIALGCATTFLLWMLDVDTPLLWGALAAMLNLTPYVGPMIMAAMLAIVGLSQFPSLGAAMLPAAGYLGLHLLESQIATPLAIGRSISLSPLAIILWLLIWGWMWGILGLLLAVPMLVCVKVICSRVEGLERWAILLEK
ncbi:MAG TPA: AI-2E family transporter [Dokdonella sp.]|uniref:AI-2E family transporter n=1 Tax=Dokdonella sp. TaxID=2291710 RepID=UPI002D7F5DD2|nr:AI-2E family transporter [Dokdonella sp.]HET9033941.1 AI-2E family transporter [Dokdonella sp.]